MEWCGFGKHEDSTESEFKSHRTSKSIELLSNIVFSEMWSGDEFCLK
jgi:hypothetical protein